MDRRRRGSPDEGYQRPRPRSNQPYLGNSTYYNGPEPGPITMTLSPGYAQPQQQMEQVQPIPIRERAASRSSVENPYSSSTDSSLLNISAPGAGRAGGILSFFKAPERRARKYHRQKKKKFFRLGNSSSSSAEEGLYYGTGYIPRTPTDTPPRREFSPSQRSQQQPGLTRRQTDEEINDIGKKLAAVARAQNREDLASIGRRPPNQWMAAATALHQFSRRNTRDKVNRGAGSSRPHHDSNSDSDSEWESASEDEADHGLAYGSAAALPFVAAAMSSPKPPVESKPRVNRRKSTVVDPTMFGPLNSLHGFVHSPCGFDDVVEDKPQRTISGPVRLVESPKPLENGSSQDRPMRTVYPGPTSDPHVFKGYPSSVTSSHQDLPRPDPVPIQAPKPVSKVSQRVFEDERFIESRSSDPPERRDSRSRSDGKSLAGAAAVGAIGLALGAGAGAAIASERKDRDDARRERDERSERRDRDERRLRDCEREYEERERERARDRDRDRDRERECLRQREREKERETEIEREGERERERARERERREKEERRLRRESKVRVVDDREPKRSSRDYKYDDVPKKHRRDTDIDVDYQPEKKKIEPDRAVDIEREMRRRSKGESSKSGRSDDRRESRKEDRREAKVSSKSSDVSTRSRTKRKSSPTRSKVSVDPFQFQVRDNSLDISNVVLPRPLTPAVVTVEREPDFSSFDLSTFQIPTERLSRKDSFERELREGMSIMERAAESTVPVGIAAATAGIAAVAIEEHERDKRGRRSEERDSRGAPTHAGDKDSVQEKADKWYRHTNDARKIAEEEIRSRSASPDATNNVEEPIIRIVTPPEMHRVPEKGPYDAPDADVRIDNKITPRDLVHFRLSTASLGPGAAAGPIFKSRDPSCERERPVLNLVLPTPVPSPTPEKQQPISKTAEPDSPRDTSEKRKSDADVVIGPRGDIVETPTSSNKSVTWGDIETKRFEVESDRDHTPEPTPEADRERFPEEQEPKPKSKPSKKASGWGMIAAAVAGAGAVELASSERKKSEDNSQPKESSSKDFDRKRSPVEPIITSTALVEEPEVMPPAPGPKPASPRGSQMPGSFADDIDFAATLAAGLKDTGFDPNIVIDDPKYRRRESPPGSNESGFYKQPVAETVSDLGIYHNGAGSEIGTGAVSEPGYVPDAAEDRSSGDKNRPIDDWDIPSNLSKKERKRLEREKRKSLDSNDLRSGAAEPDQPRETFAQGYDDFVSPDLNKKEKRRREKALKEAELAGDEDVFSSRKPEAAEGEKEVWSEAVAEQPARSIPASEDEWAEAPSSKKKSKKSSRSSVGRGEYDDSTSSRAQGSESADTLVDEVNRAEALQKLEGLSYGEDDSRVGKSSSKSKKDKKSKRSSTSWDDDEGTKSSSSGRVSVPLDYFDNIRSEPPANIDDEWDTEKKPKRRSTRDSVSSDVQSRSATASEVGTSSSRKGKKDKDKRRSGQFDGDDPGQEDPPDKRSSKRDSYKPDDRDVESVVSTPARYEGEPERKLRRSKSTSSRLDEDDDAKSIASAPATSDRKRSSKDEKRSSKSDKQGGGGLFGMLKESMGIEDRSKESPKPDDKKKNSFLGSAGIRGADAGLASAAVAVIGHALSRSEATAAPEEDTSNVPGEPADRSLSPGQGSDVIDPEIVQRAIRPAIDPQFGDLLPLPPSEPSSPKPVVEDLPPLPDSRPETPEHERNRFLEKKHAYRRSINETPVKSPSQTAVPLRFGLGRSGPSSPAAFKPSPTPSPALQGTDFGVSPRRTSRPVSWENSKGIMPLYLLESASAQQQVDEDLPALPPSEPPSTRESPAPEFDPGEPLFGPGYDLTDRGGMPLTINTSLAAGHAASDPLGSQETTPKAATGPQLSLLPGAHHIDASDTEDVFEDAESQLYPSARQSPEVFDSFDDALPSMPLSELPAKDELARYHVLGAESEEAPQEEQRDESPSGETERMSKDRSSCLLHSSPPLSENPEGEIPRDASPTPGPRRDSIQLVENALDDEKLEPENKGILPSIAAATITGGAVAAVAKMFGAHHASEASSAGGADQPEAASTESVAGEIEDKDRARVEDTAEEVQSIAAEPQADEDYAVSKKKRGKKDKKKRQSQSVDETADFSTPTEQPTQLVEEPEQIAQSDNVEETDWTSSSKKGKKKDKRGSTIDLTEPSDKASHAEGTPTAELVEGESASVDQGDQSTLKLTDEAQFQRSEQPVEEDPEGLFTSMTTGKKGKKKKNRKSSSFESEQQIQESPFGDETAPVAEQSLDNFTWELLKDAIEPPTVDASSGPVPDAPAQETLPGESVPVSDSKEPPSKKGKKKKNRKSQGWDLSEDFFQGNPLAAEESPRVGDTVPPAEYKQTLEQDVTKNLEEIADTEHTSSLEQALFAEPSTDISAEMEDSNGPIEKREFGPLDPNVVDKSAEDTPVGGVDTTFTTATEPGSPASLTTEIPAGNAQLPKRSTADSAVTSSDSLQDVEPARLSGAASSGSSDEPESFYLSQSSQPDEASNFDDSESQEPMDWDQSGSSGSKKGRKGRKQRQSLQEPPQLPTIPEVNSALGDPGDEPVGSPAPEPHPADADGFEADFNLGSTEPAQQVLSDSLQDDSWAGTLTLSKKGKKAKKRKGSAQTSALENEIPVQDVMEPASAQSEPDVVVPPLAEANVEPEWPQDEALTQPTPAEDAGEQKGPEADVWDAPTKKGKKGKKDKKRQSISSIADDIPPVSKTSQSEVAPQIPSEDAIGQGSLRRALEADDMAEPPGKLGKKEKKRRRQSVRFDSFEDQPQLESRDSVPEPIAEGPFSHDQDETSDFPPEEASEQTSEGQEPQTEAPDSMPAPSQVEAEAYQPTREEVPVLDMTSPTAVEDIPRNIQELQIEPSLLEESDLVSKSKDDTRLEPTLSDNCQADEQPESHGLMGDLNEPTSHHLLTPEAQIIVESADGEQLQLKEDTLDITGRESPWASPRSGSPVSLKKSKRRLRKSIIHDDSGFTSDSAADSSPESIDAAPQTPSRQASFQSLTSTGPEQLVSSDLVVADEDLPRSFIFKKSKKEKRRRSLLSDVEPGYAPEAQLSEPAQAPDQPGDSLASAVAKMVDPSREAQLEQSAPLQAEEIVPAEPSISELEPVEEAILEEALPKVEEKSENVPPLETTKTRAFVSSPKFLGEAPPGEPEPFKDTIPGEIPAAPKELADAIPPIEKAEESQDFTSPPKKGKKDKKKRKSLISADTVLPDDISGEQPADMKPHSTDSETAHDASPASESAEPILAPETEPAIQPEVHPVADKQEDEDDAWALTTSSKKSKKDKKKRKSLAVAESQPVEELPPPDDKDDQAIPQESSPGEDQIPSLADEGTEQGPSQEDKSELGPQVEQKEAGDDFWATETSSKKGKKRGKKAAAYEPEPEFAAAQDPEVQPTEPAPESSSLEPEPEPEPEVPEPQAEEEDHWAPTASKKNKKKKGKKAAAYDPEPEVAVAEEPGAQLEDPILDPSASLEPQPEIPEVKDEAEAEADDLWAATMPRKGKKKGKKAAVLELQPEPAAEPEPEPEPELTEGTRSAQEDEATSSELPLERGLEPESMVETEPEAIAQSKSIAGLETALKPGTSVKPETIPEPETAPEPEPVPELVPESDQQAQDDIWGAGLSKKGKKKKGKKAAFGPEPVKPETPLDSGPQTPLEQKADDDDDDPWAASGSSKKKKKKKGKPSISDPEPSKEPEPQNEPDPEPEHTGGPHLEPEPEPELEPDKKDELDDLWGDAGTSNDGKKDQRKDMLTDPEPEKETEVQNSETISEPIPETEPEKKDDAEWPEVASGKKKKKDKKKKKVQSFDWDEPESQADPQPSAELALATEEVLTATPDALLTEETSVAPNDEPAADRERALPSSLDVRTAQGVAIPNDTSSTQHLPTLGEQPSLDEEKLEEPSISRQSKLPDEPAIETTIATSLDEDVVQREKETKDTFEVTAPARQLEEAIKHVVLEKQIVAEPESIEAPSLQPEETETPEFFMPTGKKKKSKKKRESQIIQAESETPTASSELESEGPTAKDLGEPTTLDSATAITTQPAAVEEPFENFPSKKSKKEKRKSKRSSQVLALAEPETADVSLEMEPETLREAVQQGAIEESQIPSAIQEDDASRSPDLEMTAEDEGPAIVPKTVQSESNQPPAEEPPQQAEEGPFEELSVKSKKDQKKATRQSQSATLEQESPPVESILEPEPTAKPISAPIPDDEQLLATDSLDTAIRSLDIEGDEAKQGLEDWGMGNREVLEPPAEEFASPEEGSFEVTSGKKSKKQKKKEKRTSSIALPSGLNPVQVNEGDNTESQLSMGYEQEPVSPPEEIVATGIDQAIVSDAIPSAELEFGDSGVTQKKSKDKKRKGTKQSDYEPASETLAPISQEQDNQIDDFEASVVREAADPEMSREVSLDQTVEAAGDDEFPEVLSKKSRKKKGRKGSLPIDMAAREVTPSQDEASNTRMTREQSSTPFAPEPSTGDAETPTSKAIWDDDSNFFRPKTNQYADDLPLEGPSLERADINPLGHVEINPVVSDLLEPSTKRSVEEMVTGMPSVGLGLINCDMPDLLENDGHVPKLLTNQSYSNAGISSEEPSQLVDSAKAETEAVRLPRQAIAEDTSRLTHEPPVEGSPRPGKKARTRTTDSIAEAEIEPPFSMPNTSEWRDEPSISPVVEEDAQESTISAREIAAHYLDPDLPAVPVSGEHLQTEGGEQANNSEGVSDESSAREIAASYLESGGRSTGKPTDTSSGSEKGGKLSRGKDTNKEVAATAGVAGAVGGGVAMLAQKFGGTKKGKGKKKNKKSVDKRTPREDDMFDDPALWEGADRRPLEGSRMDMDTDNFWDASDPAPAKAEAEAVAGEKQQEQPEQTEHLKASDERSTAPQDESLRYYNAESQEDITHPLPASDEMDFVESPVLGRSIEDDRPRDMARGHGEDLEIATPATMALERHADDTYWPSTDEMDVKEPKAPLAERQTQEDDAPSQAVYMSPRLSELHELRHSRSTQLAPVQEEPVHERLEEEQARSILGTPEINRDSGFVADSPHLGRRGTFDDEVQRDSGVHLRETPETSPRRGRETRRFSPDPAAHRMGIVAAAAAAAASSTPVTPASRGVHGRIRAADTPRLGEPATQPRTPEPQKSAGTVRKQRSRYESLAGAEPAIEPAVRGRARGEATPSPSPSTDAATRRSVSDRYGQSQAKDRQNSGIIGGGALPRRSASNTSLSLTRQRTPEPLNLRPESRGSIRSMVSARSGTPSSSTIPSLRRLHRRPSGGDLRSLSQRSQPDLVAAAAGAGVVAGAAAVAGSRPSADKVSTAIKDRDREGTLQNSTPVANEGRVRAKDMTDVYDGYGEGRVGSPRSPTRPHSMRRRQSMQILELESRVDQLAAENRMLSEARLHSDQQGTSRTASALAERDAEIETLRQNLSFLQREVDRLTEVNEGLNSATSQLAVQHDERFRRLESDHAQASRELEQTRALHGQHAQTLQDKDAEIEDLRTQLETAKEEVRQMQAQILENKPPGADFLGIHDVDYFDHRCQQLCSHVQQWVLRFSKFSDMRACRLTSEINDERTIDRLDNAVLDGSDVDVYLNDRVRRRDIFMSMTMNMIWEFVFTRYLFGMDREQRQKLKSLEKLLLDVGPPQAVRLWRAVTLTLLSKRIAFKEQREQDTEAVVQAIFQTLSTILPPPSHLENQIQIQLRRVMREAVELSIEMRTQKAEYMMLPPLQPNYDENGELAETVVFNASLMNERSGSAGRSNEELEASGAVVRVVLFPLVVRKGDDDGVDEDEVVVCPAQVLVARPHGGGNDQSPSSRMYAASSDAGGVSLLGGRSPSAAGRNQSSLSVSMQDAPDAPAEAEYLEGGI